MSSREKFSHLIQKPQICEVDSYLHTISFSGKDFVHMTKVIELEIE